MNNPFWDYSVTLYNREEVAQACLQLQDSFGLDVNLLLYAAWLAQLDRRLEQAHLTGIAALVTDWRENVVKPLRAVRRTLRGYPLVTDVREEARSLELHAEQSQQDMMYEFYLGAAVLPPSAHSQRDNLALVAKHTNPDVGSWAGAIERLAILLAS